MESQVVSRVNRHRNGTFAIKMAPYGFLAPFFILFVFLFIAPILYAIFQALYNQHSSGLGLGVSKTVFVGLSNFRTVLETSDFWTGLGRVALFAVVQIPVMMILALALALLLDTKLIKFRRFFRFSIFLPYAVPGVMAAILWSFLYLPNLSPILSLLHHIPGMHNFTFVGSHSVLWSIANIVTWEWAGYDMLIFIASLQSIAPELYEAARVEGASEWQIAWKIKIPLLYPSVGMSALFSIIGTLQLFNEPTILKSMTPNVTSTYTPNMYAYSAAFGQDNYHMAAAIAVLMAVITFVFSFLLLRFLSRRGAL